MWFLPISILVATTILAIPVSRYLAWIMNGKYRAPAILRWFEDRLNSGPQNWKQYVASLLIFNTVLFVFGFIVLALQPWMPLNSLNRGMLEPSTIFHTVVSFMTNTDVQHYSGDQHFSNFTQMFFCFSQFFLSASIGFCSLTAIIRAFRGDPHLGNFFVDMWRVVVYMFLPISLRFGRALPAARQPDDLRLRSNRSPRSSRAPWEPIADGTAKQQTVVVGPVAGLCADQAIGHQRWRVLRHEQRPSVRESDGAHQLVVLRRNDAVPVRPGVDVRPNARPIETRLGHFLRDDGVDGRHDRVGRLLRHAETESSIYGALRRRNVSSSRCDGAGRKTGRSLCPSVAGLPVDQQLGQSGRQGAAIRHLGRRDLRRADRRRDRWRRQLRTRQPEPDGLACRRWSACGSTASTAARASA